VFPYLTKAEARRLGKVALFGGWLSFRPPPFRFATKPTPLDGCPMFALSRTWVEHDIFPMLSPPVYTDLQEKKKEGALPIFFNPCTRKSANMGHPSRGQGLVRKREICCTSNA
jgi:hypothetical protein